MARNSFGEKVTAGAVLLGLLGVVVGYGGLSASWYSTKNEARCTVQSKTATSTKQGTDYRVFTEQCGVMQIQDDVLLSRFNSADEYGKLREGTDYTFKTVGWRNGFFSMFPNVVEVTR